MISERNGFPVKNKGVSKAGITIHIDPVEDESDPFDVTLYIKKPREGEDLPNPDDDGSLTTTGKLSFRFGKRGSVELFAENTSKIDGAETGQEEEEI